MGQTDSHPQRQKQAEYRRKVHQNAQNENRRPKSNDFGNRGRAPQKPLPKIGNGISKPTVQQKAPLNAVYDAMITDSISPVELSREDERVLQMLDRAAVVNSENLARMISSTHIRHGSSHTYESLFAKYMGNDLTVIRIGEPYLQQFHQMRNLVNFLECCVANAPSLRVIKLETKVADNPEEQQKNMRDVAESLKIKGIAFIVEYTNIHDRKIW